MAKSKKRSHGKTSCQNHMAFKGKFSPTQHKGRRVPFHLLERLEKELEKLIEDKQIVSAIHKNKYQMQNIDHLI